MSLEHLLLLPLLTQQWNHPCMIQIKNPH